MLGNFEFYRFFYGLMISEKYIIKINRLTSDIKQKVKKYLLIIYYLFLVI